MSAVSFVLFSSAKAQQQKLYAPELNLNTSDTWDFYAQPPYLNVAPSDAHYTITRAIEYIQSLSSEKAHILNMRKRAAELVNWGTSMDTIIDVENNSVPSLLHWWNKNKHAPTHYNSWEAELSQYAIDCASIIHKHALNQSGAEFYQSMARMIHEDKMQLNGIINDKGHKIHNREQILTLTNSVFNYCLNQIERQGFATDPFTTNYQIGDDAVYVEGTYSAFLTQPDLSYDKIATILSSKTTAQFQKNNENTDLLNTKGLFTIGQKDTFIHVKIPTSNLAEKNGSLKTQDDETTTHVVAEIKIPDMIHTSEFLLKIHLPQNSSDLLIQKQSLAMDTSRNTFVPYTFSYPRSAKSTKSTYEEILYGNHGEITKSVLVHLTIPLGEAEPKIELYPIYHPPLTLVGHGYQLTRQTHSFWPSRSHLKTLLFGIVFTSIGIIFITFRQKFATLKRIFLGSEVAVLIYIPIFAASYALDIFLYPKNISLYPLLLLLYLFILFSLYPSIQLLVKALALQLAAGFFFFLTHHDAYSEPIFRWASLQIPIILAYAYSPNPQQVRPANYKEFWFYKIIIGLFRIVKTCLFIVINKLFIISPRNTRDMMRNVLVAAALLAFFIAAHISYQKAIYIKSNFDRIPIVDVYEPRIIYKSNFVLIKGRHFGWNQDHHSYLSTQLGKIESTVWTENEIIFQIPLWLPEKQIPITIVKKDDWFGTKKDLMSRPFTLSVISRTDGWGPEDDDYFNQLDHLSEKTLKLNGYK